ncbi:MAG: hypothetical protein ACR2PF_10045, partial [Rhizobiaceae bacterium]
VHAFIVAWFQGNTVNNRDTFRAELEIWLAEGVINIQPSVHSLSRSGLDVEDQRGARNTVPADDFRITTVLFDVSGPNPVWLHLHETAVV